MPTRSRKSKDSSIWAERMQRLIWATGESHSEMGKRFGVSGHTISRLLCGQKTRINVTFVRRLQNLEAQFDADLKALKEGLIMVRGRRRYCWIKPEPPPVLTEAVRFGLK